MTLDEFFIALEAKVQEGVVFELTTGARIRTKDTKCCPIEVVDDAGSVLTHFWRAAIKNLNLDHHDASIIILAADHLLDGTDPTAIAIRATRDRLLEICNLEEVPL